jgi:hypothetical protein
MSEQRQQAVGLTLVSLERGTEPPVLAFAAVAVSIAGVDIVIHGISIVRDGPELVCRTPHHPRNGRAVSSIEVTRQLADAIAELVFGAYDNGLAVPAPMLSAEVLSAIGWPK